MDLPSESFERLYVQARHGEAVVPWDLPAPGQLLVEWTRRQLLDGAGRSALVVGCGLGRDAEFIAGLGFDTVAFDIAPTAVRTARERHPETRVRYEVADLLDPPTGWLENFDLVVENMNVQALPDPPRANAIHSVGRLVKRTGTLIVLAFGRKDGAEVTSGPPWPLTRDEIDAFAGPGLDVVSIEELADETNPAILRWRAEFHRP